MRACLLGAILIVQMLQLLCVSTETNAGNSECVCVYVCASVCVYVSMCECVTCERGPGADQCWFLVWCFSLCESLWTLLSWLGELCSIVVLHPLCLLVFPPCLLWGFLISEWRDLIETSSLDSSLQYCLVVGLSIHCHLLQEEFPLITIGQDTDLWVEHNIRN